MSQKTLLRLVAVILVLEAVAAMLLPGRMPRAARVPTAGTAFVAAVALWTLARQKFPGR
jgi:hypothetical protein